MSAPVGAATFYGDLKELATVHAYEGWEHHNRGTRGDGWGPVHGVLIHHTVTKSTAAAIAMCSAGRPDLPGPLYNVVVDKKGVCHLIGWGRANHAGTGDPTVLEHVIREELPYPAPHFVDGQAGGVDFNARFYGIAMLNLGNGDDPYPKAQLDATATVAALLCAIHGWSERSVIGHKESQKGKIDPSTGMGSFRTRVRNRRTTVVDPHFRARS